MWTLAALATYVAAFAACLAVARTARRRARGLDAVIAFALLICGEALVVHALSSVHLLGRAGLLAGNAALVTACGAVAWKRRGALCRPGGLRCLVHPATAVVAALGGLALFATLAYVPNNWDGMTYHLARVAHWLQHRSVGPYPTNIPRQLVLTPGAEYAIVGLQGISGNDRLAGLVQLGAWLAIAAAAPPLARTFGAPRRLAPWAAVVAAAGPLGIQQAATVQNDLVAGSLAVAVVATALPFLHRRPRWRSADVVLLVVAVTAGAAAKPTSLAVAAPFLAWGAARAAATLRRAWAWRRIAVALPSLAIAAGVLGPFAWTRASAGHDPAAMLRPFVYDAADGVPDRLLNSARALARNLAFATPLLDGLAPPQTLGCPRPGSLCLEANARWNEDLTGSRGPALVLLGSLVFALSRVRRLASRTRLGLASLVAAWILFNAVFRDNVWTPRLHLAYFAVAPLSLAAFQGRWIAGRWAAAVVRVVAAALALSGVRAALASERHPLDDTALAWGRLPWSYYREGPLGVAAQHRAVLRALGASGCRRLGLYVGADSYDYPLTWRAMQAGVEVRHVLGPDGWPCAIFSDRGRPPGADLAWRPTEHEGLWVPATAPADGAPIPAATSPRGRAGRGRAPSRSTPRSSRTRASPSRRGR